MGSGQSQAEEEGGFRIFKVNPGSPAFEAGLEVFFDFIIEINGTKMDSDQNTFFTKIQEAENKRTKLVVYNIRTHQTRDVLLTPRRWGGSGLLGAVVRYDALDNADSQGIRVLDVFPSSPAQSAGLVPNKDYLLGTTEVMFRDMDELVEIVNLCLGKKMQIYVYNTDSESIRDVTIVPNTNWGGEGAIGADIRTGLLHRIPPPRRKGMNAAALAQSAMVASQAPATTAAAHAALASAAQHAVHPVASPAAATHLAAQQQAGAAHQVPVAACAAAVHPVASPAAATHLAAQQQAAAAQQALADGTAQAPMLASALVHHSAPEATLAFVAAARPAEALPGSDAHAALPVTHTVSPELVVPAPLPQEAQTQGNVFLAQAQVAPAVDPAALAPVPEAAPASQLPVGAVPLQTPTGSTASLIDGVSALLASSVGQETEPERILTAGEMLPPRVPPSTPMAPAEATSYHMDAFLDVKSPGVVRIPPDIPTSVSPTASAAIDVNGDTHLTRAAGRQSDRQGAGWPGQDTAMPARALHYDMAAGDHHLGFDGVSNGVPSVAQAAAPVAAAPLYAQQLQQQPQAAPLVAPALAGFAAPSSYVSSQYVMQGTAPGVIYETPPTAPFGAPAPAMAAPALVHAPQVPQAAALL